MRLLQLLTAPDRLIDLHPNVSVVRGLEAAERQLLADTVAGLAQGVAPSVFGLLEAHDLLFDLSDEMLALLEVAGADLRPVVTMSDLPTAPRDPRAAERNAAERNVADLDEALRVAGEEQQRLQITRDLAADALELARQNAHQLDAGAPERIRLIDELTAQLAQIEERRRPLLEAKAERGRKAEAAAAERVAISAAAAELRNRHQDAAVLCTELAGRLDQARLGLDPGSVAEADAVAEELARVQAQVQAQVQAAVEAARAEEGAVGDVEAAAGADEAPDGEPRAERLARVQARIEELEKCLAAFGPSEVRPVADALSQLRAGQNGELVPSPAAQALADQLEVLDADLPASAGVGADSQALADGRARLDGARHALFLAEQAARSPELDRDVVDRLELAHADVLLALEKADGRFGGGRAAKRVEEARSTEQVILDELGLASYSDFMMGYSLLNVDPEKEGQLETARAELAAAEDEMRALEAEAAAERTRGEREEQRGRLLDDAGELLGHPVEAARAVSELRALRLPATIAPELVQDLQRSLDDAGVAVGDEDLSREELMVLAEAWLDEAEGSSDREQALRRELADLTEERREVSVGGDAAEARAAPKDPRANDDASQDLVRRAQADVDVVDARRRNHVEAEAMVATLTADLAAAGEAERQAAVAAADAEASVAEATVRAERLAADAVRICEELETLLRTASEVTERLQAVTVLGSTTPEDRAREILHAEKALTLADDHLGAATIVLAGLEADRIKARALVEWFQADEEPSIDSQALAEEVEWYLIARLATQRAVCLGGSVPMLIDDALAALDQDQLNHVLDRLERMADAVQVIVVSDDPRVSAWAVAAGFDRAAAVDPEPLDSVSEPQTAAPGATT